jgi:hypothetical protein
MDTNKMSKGKAGLYQSYSISSIPPKALAAKLNIVFLLLAPS